MKNLYKIVGFPFFVYWKYVKFLANLTDNNILGSIIMLTGMIVMLAVDLFIPEKYQLLYFVFVYIQLYCYEKV